MVHNSKSRFAILALSTAALVSLTSCSDDRAERGRVLGQQAHREFEEGRLLAESFLADVQAGHLDQAYDVFSAPWWDREKPRREAFATMINKQLAFKNPRLPLSGEVTESPPYGTYDYYGLADSEDGKVVKITISVESKEGVLRIYQYHVGTAEE